VRELLTVDRAANQIRMRRSTFFGVFLLVEGSSDKVFYERFVDKTVYQFIFMEEGRSRKSQVITVLGILEDSSVPGVLAIVDADLDRLEPSQYNSPNLLRTDTHDLETMLIDSPALDKVIAEFGSEEKIAKFGSVRAALIEAGISIGYLRWISISDKLKLTFKGIKFSNFINKQTLQLDELELIEEVKKKSQNFSLDNRDIQQWMANKKSDNHDPFQVCCGHDLVEILSLGLCNAIGTMKQLEVEVVSLERSLRFAYEEVYFQKTQLYADIQKWEVDNQMIVQRY
jgi:Protein of unknown function (DUF4435)